jgi:peptide/nickel transport system substrate-binding protein
MTREIARRFAASALLALAFSACTKVDAPASTAATGSGASGHADRLILSDASDPRNLNPALASADPVLPLAAYLFSFTVRYDDHARPVPDAVSEIPTTANGDVSRDGLTIKYKLRHGIKWHDGGELTCRDLRFTWQVMMNPKNNVVTTDGWSDIRDVDCSDPYVAVVHLKKIYAPFLQQLWSVNGNGPILPEHILGKLNDSAGSLNSAPYNSAPIGSGPYKFVSWERGSQVRLAAFPDYFLGKPKIGEVIFKIIPDQNTLATQLQTHEVDVGWNLAPTSYDTVRKIAGSTTTTPVIYTYDHIDFNLRRPLFADVRVRRALTYAIDRPTLLHKLRHDLGELSATFLGPTLYPFAQAPQIMHYPYDPIRAKQLLDQAGWHVGADGMRVKNGQRLAFQLSTQTESTTGHLIQAQLQTYWHAIGAAAEIKNYPTPVFFDNTAAGTLQGGKYDIATFAWVGAPDIDNSAIYSGHNLAPHGQNALFWQNAVATKAMDDANETVDQQRRIADYRVVQREFAKDDPSIILWFRKDVIVTTDALHGFSATPVITIPFWNPQAYSF